MSKLKLKTLYVGNFFGCSLYNRVIVILVSIKNNYVLDVLCGTVEIFWIKNSKWRNICVVLNLPVVVELLLNTSRVGIYLTKKEEPAKSRKSY